MSGPPSCNFEKEIRRKLVTESPPPTKKGWVLQMFFFSFFLLDESFKNKVSRPGDDSQLLTRIKKKWFMINAVEVSWSRRSTHFGQWTLDRKPRDWKD